MAETKVNILQVDTKDSINSLSELKKSIKDLKGKLISLDEGTEEYNKTLKELSDKTFILKDVQEKAMRSMSDTGEVLANVGGLAGSVTSAIGGVTAGMQLLGVESEEAEKGMLKLVQLMSLSQSFTAIEDGIDRFKNLKIAVSGVTKGLGKMKLALGGLGIGVVVTALGVLASKLHKVQEETNEVNEYFNDLADATGDDIVKFEMLQTAWRNLGDDIESKEQFVVDNKDKFNELGVAVNSVVDAENLLVKNSSAFIGAIEARADAQINYEKLVEARKAKLEADAKYQYHKEKYDAGEGHLYRKDKANDEKIKANKEYDEQLKLYTESKKKLEELMATVDVATTAESNNTESVDNNTESLKNNIEALKEKKRTQQEIIDQGLIYAETEEDAVDETDLMAQDEATHTGNEGFKYDNKTDSDYVDKAIAMAQAVADAEMAIALETTENYQKQKDKRIAIAKSAVDGMMMIMSSTSQLLTMLDGNIDKSTKKGFEQSKKYQVGMATINYLQGLISAWSSSMQLAFPISVITAGALTTLLSTMYGINVQKIKSAKFGGSTSGSTSTPKVSAEALNTLQNTVTNVRPTLNQSDIEALPAQKVYVLSSDIEESLNTRKVTVKNSTF